MLTIVDDKCQTVAHELANCPDKYKKAVEDFSESAKAYLLALTDTDEISVQDVLDGNYDNDD